MISDVPNEPDSGCTIDGKELYVVGFNHFRDRVDERLPKFRELIPICDLDYNKIAEDCKKCFKGNFNDVLDKYKSNSQNLGYLIYTLIYDVEVVTLEEKKFEECVEKEVRKKILKEDIEYTSKINESYSYLLEAKKKNKKKGVSSEKKIETFGWEDGIYLSTGDDWDWNPDKERELDEEKAFEDPYPYDQIEFEEKCLDHYIHTELSKYDSINSKSYYDEDYYYRYRRRKTKQKEPKYKNKADAFNKLSFLIEKELPVIYTNSIDTSKELKHNKMLISLYKKLQNEIYKQELRELIRSDIYFCNTYTQEIVQDVTYLYSEEFFELNGNDFYAVLKLLEDEFELYLKEKEKYESENK